MARPRCEPITILSTTTIAPVIYSLKPLLTAPQCASIFTSPVDSLPSPGAYSELISADGTLLCSGREWYQTDLLGNVLARTDQSGAVTARMSFRPYGEMTAQNAIAGTRGFNSRSFDGNDGLYDYGARQYARPSSSGS